MIRSIFYARFHAQQGPRVLHQVPELKEPLFDFQSVRSCIIPRQEFCDRLVTVCVSHYRIIGYPVCISDEGKYNRNEFIFNFALVIDEDVEDWASYASVVRKFGRLLRALEEQGGFLSTEESPNWGDDKNESSASVASPSSRPQDAAHSINHQRPGAKLYALCEMILEDLNNYRECMIPLDDSNAINLKLFPMHPSPAPVHSWHVPLLTINPSSFSSQNISSDLTLQRILRFMDGINSVLHISDFADTDIGLTRKAIQHLVYYGCVILLDIFQFSAIYAPTAEIGHFVIDRAIQEECARYVRTPRATITMRRTSTGDTFPEEPEDRRPSQAVTDMACSNLITLYATLQQGKPLRTWCLDNMELLAGIDVRRLITFGVIKGFLYRVHKYAIATSSTVPSPQKADHSFRREQNEALRMADGEAVWEGGEHGDLSLMQLTEGRNGSLEKYLDGMHSFDEICTELGSSEKVVMGRVREFGDVQFIMR